MKYKVEGESSEGNYLDGQSFDTEQEANQEVWYNDVATRL